MSAIVRTWKRWGVALAAVAPVAAAFQLQAQQALTADDSEFFEAKIRPLLIDSCYKCHSSTAEKVKGGLTLDSKEATLKGGTTGPAVVPGNVEKSLMVKAVRYTDPDLRMPPKEKLSDSQIADLEAWVRRGAPDPRSGKQAGILKSDSDREKAKQHWSFRPVKKPEVPESKFHLTKWIQSPIDSFIVAKLAEKDLLPSPIADKWTLIRRAYFDLIGLPPTPQQVEAFVNDESPDAFAKVVNELLNSPQYGERWGRYWLDIARYADTKGGNGNINPSDQRFLYSYTYRDYVVNAFNEDLPYDQFLMQQIAADQMDLSNNKRALTAMGFLTLGREGNNIQEVIDDRIDVLTRGTQGLTVYCARCHDHKFDPVPTKDYYSLYGILASCVEPQQKPVVEMPANTKQYEDYIRQRSLLDAQLENFRSSTQDKYVGEAKARTLDYLIAAHQQITSDRKIVDRADQAKFEKDTKLEFFVLTRWERYLRGRGDKDPVFGPWKKFADLKESEFSLKAKEITAQLAGMKGLNPAVAKSFSSPPSNFKVVAERYATLLVTADKQWTNAVTLAEKLKAKDDSVVIPKALPDAAMEQIRKYFYAADSPVEISYDQIANLNNQKIRRLENPIRDEIVKLEVGHPGAPARAMILTDAPNPRNARVLIKGMPSNPGPEVPRQFLEIASAPDRKPFTKGSGRLDLAKAIISKDNPLTARVMVNRIWQNHFGNGLVRTPSDFGMRSEDPTHPELLDWLASTFMESGWSIKKMHRMIMLSSTYQQSSEERPKCAQVDPSNLLLYKMNRRRLDFEAFRDGLVSVGGRLDLKMGGQSITNLMEGAGMNRRTLYALIDRRNLPDFFRTFDFANPDITSGQRFNSTVPQQALFMMNSPFVANLSRELLDRPEVKTKTDEDERIEALYQVAYQRPPSQVEVKLGKRFLEAQSGITPMAMPEPTWRYGFGEYDDTARTVKRYTAMQYTSAKAYQPNTRDTRLRLMKLTADGGYPGPSRQLAVIRRWTAPRDMTVAIDAALGHPASPAAMMAQKMAAAQAKAQKSAPTGMESDGVRGIIYCSRTGELGRWTAVNQRVDTKIAKVDLKKGDTIDFIVDCNGNAIGDTFTWAPTIRVVEAGQMSNGMMMASSGEEKEWRAATDFGSTGKTSAPKPLGTWEKYAQVLLLANEISFVD